MKIFVIGDSHAYNGWQNIQNSLPGVYVHIRHLGPKLMYSLKTTDLEFVRREKINQGDILVFCFGEIDARCHIHKYEDAPSVISNMVKQYLNIIRDIVFGLPKIQVCLYFVPPAVHSEGLYNNPEYPYVGTDEDRKKYVISINDRLNQMSKEFGYIFIDLTRDYTDDDGFLRKELSDGGPHIKETKPLINFIKGMI